MYATAAAAEGSSGPAPDSPAPPAARPSDITPPQRAISDRPRWLRWRRQRGLSSIVEPGIYGVETARTRRYNRTTAKVVAVDGRPRRVSTGDSRAAVYTGAVPSIRRSGMAEWARQGGAGGAADRVSGVFTTAAARSGMSRRSHRRCRPAGLGLLMAGGHHPVPPLFRSSCPPNPVRFTPPRARRRTGAR